MHFYTLENRVYAHLESMPTSEDKEFRDNEDIGQESVDSETIAAGWELDNKHHK